MGKIIKLFYLIVIVITCPVYGDIKQAQDIFENCFDDSDLKSDNIKNKLKTIDTSNNAAVNYLKNNKKPKIEQPQVGNLLSPKTEKIDSSHYFKSEEKLEEYSPSEMGETLTHFAAIKSISDPMKDGLGGIGQNTNPTVMQGKCQRCTITLGSVFKDCCDLNGIAKGLLGGCRQEEKELANAALKDKRCILVQQKYCTKKKFGVCIEKKSAYCCYGSEMGKIIQEIAHQQLAISWGDGKNPNCASLTAEQLSRLDFNTPFARAKLAVLVSAHQTVGTQNASQVKNKLAELQNKLSNQYKNPVARTRK